MFYRISERVLEALLRLALSRWPDPKPATNQSESKPGDLVVGTQVRSGQSVVLTVEDRRRHLWLAGSTGGGKTNLLLRIIDADLDAKKTVVVVDRHGDLIDRLLVRLASRLDLEPRQVCLIDLRGSNVVGFSPFVVPGDAYGKATYTLSVIRRLALSWGVDLEQTLRCVLLALAEAGATLVEIEPVLSDSDARRRLMERVSDPFVKSFFARYDALKPEGQRTLMNPVLNKVSGLLAIPKVRQMLGSSQPIPLERILNAPGQIVLVGLDASATHDTAGLVGGMFINAVTMIALARSEIPEPSRNPVSLVVDECEHMLNDAFLVALAEGRKYGLSLVLANQNLAQLPTDLRDGILANTGVQLYFQTSAGDAGHLAQELVSPDSREALRKVLVSQGVGLAFLARRGQPSIQVQTIYSPDPKPDVERIRLLKESSAQTYSSQRVKPRANAKPRAAKQAASPKQREDIAHERRPML